MRRWPLSLLLALLTGCGQCANTPGSGEPEDFKLTATIPQERDGFATALYQTVGAETKVGNTIDIVNNGAIFDVVASDIARAKTSLSILMYIWAPGEASDRIVQAIVSRMRHTPLDCRILVDTFGSRGFDKKIAPKLTEVGCDVRMFRTEVDDTLLERNHRKVIVIDGRIGLLGGFGIRDDWLGDGHQKGQWRDTNARVEGPAVRGLQRAFAENWIETTGELLPAEAFPSIAAKGRARAAVVTSSDESLTRAERLVQLMIKTARKRLWIANAYVVPSDTIVELLEERAKAGVDVRLLTAGSESDSKFAFASQQIDLPRLSAKGVRTWEYEPSMMHAKTMVVDDRFVVVGSINFEPLSLGSLEEVAIVVDDREVNRRLAADFLEDLRFAEEVGEPGIAKSAAEARNRPYVLDAPPM